MTTKSITNLCTYTCAFPPAYGVITMQLHISLLICTWVVVIHTYRQKQSFELLKLDYSDFIIITPSGGLDDVSLTAIGRSCPNLTDLNISWCRNVTDDGMICFLERVSQLQVIHNISSSNMIEQRFCVISSTF